MKFVAITLCAIIVVAAAIAPAAPGQDGSAETLRFDSVVNTDSFNYGFETSNGIKSQVEGQLKQIGAEYGIASHGEFSYVGNDGQTYTVVWVADENGFQAKGSHLPVAPIV